jgi:DNA-binding NtrC family response regulator
MPRKTDCKQINSYHYELILDNERKYTKTMQELMDILQLTQTTIFRKMKNPDIQLRKYKGRNLQIIRINKPVFKIAEIDYIN